MTARQKMVSEGFVSVREAAEIIGCSKTRAYELIEANTISHIRHGRRIKVPLVAARAYAAQNVKIGDVA